MILKKIGNCIYHIRANSQYELAISFLRMQEYTESTFEGIHRQFFTLEQFMDRYAEKFGNFTYTEEYTGFNLTSENIHPFLKVFPVASLSSKEKKLLDMIHCVMTSQDVLENNGKFALIGTCNRDDLDHEISHAMYYIVPEYAKSVKALVKRLGKERTKELRDALVKMGYNPAVAYDEIGAFTLEGRLKELDPKIKKSDATKISTTFKNTFRKYKSQYITNDPYHSAIYCE